jgi:hypothetical protein
MKTFQEWLGLQEGRFDQYPSAYDGGNTRRRVDGLSYGGRSLADKYGSYLRPLTDDFHPKTGMLRDASQPTQEQIVKTLERAGLVLSRHGDRFEVKDDEGNMVFSSSNILDLEKTLRDNYGYGDSRDVHHNDAGIRSNAIRKMELRDRMK